MANSKDRSHSRSRPHRRDFSNRDHPRSRDCSRGVEESYDNTRSSYGTGTKHGYRSRDKDRSRYKKIGRGSESPLSLGSKSGTNGGGHWKSKWIQGSQSSLFSILHAAKEVRSKYLSKIQISWQRTERTSEEFMERFKVETPELWKGALECMRIPGFMYRVNNPELTKRLNEHVPKTMEEMMIATTAFIRGEAVAAGKKKGHAS
ncbi:hypothetical protein Tco_0893207 [Tanacetum coccineum]|uniref:Reverse transcriptase domain-containing protein n=1 Tax=Tanacetum coccineum TaxID=301880 RepID=A0ABQ5C8N0_9ASTR